MIKNIDPSPILVCNLRPSTYIQGIQTWMEMGGNNTNGRKYYNCKVNVMIQKNYL